VASALACAQLALCSVTIGVAQAGTGWVLLAGAVGLVFGAGLIWRLESSPLFKVVRPPLPAPQSLEPRGVETIIRAFVSLGGHRRAASVQEGTVRAPAAEASTH
jgi:hypothetical protein